MWKRRKVRLRLEKIQRDFLWGGGALEQRPHLVRWNLVCLERKKGGLGVRNLVLMNKALLRGGWCTWVVSGRHGVGLWKAIGKEWLGMYSSLAYRVGSGRRVRFWKDKWCGDEPLCESFPSLFAISQAKDAWVSDVWNPDGVGDGWTLLFLRAFNDWEIKMVERFMLKIQAFRVQREDEDKVVWTTSRSGVFSVKLLYSILEPRGSSLFPYGSIWRANVPPKVAFFAWETSWGKILTLEQLQRRGGVANVEWLAFELGCMVGKLPTIYLALPLGAPPESLRAWEVDSKERTMALTLEEQNARKPSCMDLPFDALGGHDVALLEVPFFEEEAFKTLLDLSGDKAPDLDSFSLLFWQFSWDFVKDEVLGFFRDFLKGNLLSWHDSFVGKKGKKAWRASTLSLFGVVLTHSRKKRQIVDASQGHASSYHPSTTVSEAVSWNMHRADNHSTENGMFSNSSYHHVQQTEPHLRNAQDGLNAASAVYPPSSLGAASVPQQYNGYTTYPSSNDPYSYGNTGYPGSYAGPASYPSTYYNPGDYQTSGGHSTSGYSNQSNLWSEGNYANYSHQYANYTPDSNGAYSSSTAAATSLQYQQHYKQWADYYSQTEVSCAPGTENMSVTSTSNLACPIPGVTSGYSTSASHPPQPSISSWGSENSSALPSVQPGAAISDTHDGYWKHGAPSFQNHHDQQKTACPQGSNLQYPTAHKVSHSYQSPLQTIASLDTRRVNKLQIPTKPRIASNLALGLPKIDKDSSATGGAAKPAYIGVSVPKPSDKVLSHDGADAILKVRSWYGIPEKICY
ncbi:SAC3 family protein A [Vitis vinifera]|uniref:SAC3 family protein A n=1 Tax=Vitis vinifera TaxID=29760 RepID=A0A438EP07_VITVI|nr:SAC3 family protein A [Vitis vinifera]